MAAKTKGITFVEVTARFDIFGNIMPVSIMWEDGTVYDIDNVLTHKNVDGLQKNSVATMFIVIIKEEQKCIFLDNGRWYVKPKKYANTAK